ncbi:RagB/SusD family nutrient uptake outer membrane protein [Chitinophaga deserti]|uniref:RagB/SusD family nutrient uptake outer membrane protein n=1 Tax=Chitinophaga deserti TaxID=2164099 RepID=UPI0018E4F09D|nr:RagB/SusD family nutrient uptake outer membrane protein [Chitinophaga deserti]
MKKTIYGILAGATMLLAAGCNKYLDIKPKGFTIPELVEDYQKLLNSQDLYRAVSAYPVFLTDDVQSGVDNDVNRAAGFSTYSLFKRNLYTFEKGQVMEQGQQDVQWEPNYSHIFTFNAIINNVMTAKDGSDTDKRRIRAEALVGRAFEYLTLVNLYAKHYDPATADKDLGVPMILSEDINATYERVSVAAVYAQIKKDLDEAIPDLSERVPNNFHPPKSVGYAFLSRMYLYMGDYQKALFNANEALKLNNQLMDYKIYTTKKGTFGRVCKLSDSTAFPEVQKNIESLWVRLGTASSGTVFAEVYATEDLITTYKNNLAATSEDYRYKLFYCDGKAQFGASVINFPGRVLWASYVDANVGLSTPEVILTAAECEARVGDKDKAMTLINRLRDYRIANNQPLVAADKEIALRMVLDERRREMAFVGSNRLVDLKRLNKDPRFAKTVTHKHADQTYTLPANDNRYILPVPPRVLSMNPGIPQYER